MGEIKSAWEIAQNKADKLGMLSLEEQRRQKEEKYSHLGKALASKYLDKERTNYLLKEMQKYSGQDRQILIHATIESLAERIDIKHNQNSKKINEGIQAISDGRATRIINQIDALINEYQQAETEERQRIEKAGKEILHGIRINGTAIGNINIQANAEWKQCLEQLNLAYRERLIDLKQSLLSS